MKHCKGICPNALSVSVGVVKMMKRTRYGIVKIAIKPGSGSTLVNKIRYSKWIETFNVALLSRNCYGKQLQFY